MENRIVTPHSLADFERSLEHSPYLSRLALAHPEIVREVTSRGADAAYADLLSVLASHDDLALFMQQLRVAKNKVALLVAAADITGHWPLTNVTKALSDFAERSLVLTVNHLLMAAHKRDEITLKDPNDPAPDSGIIVLGLGKLGGYELNYSSDIDLIILFEPGKLAYKGRHNEQHFMNKLAYDVVHVLQERTADGYVFRTDLRLRPDPASTPPAINVEAAYYYYEGVGQNWERAAMIKARPVAGDIKAGERFLKNLAPFMWRRNLDFAAINDIHSIKRQMDARQHKVIQLAGHNIKLGLGGIREIEFYVQIHQLIWGGRELDLRTLGTLETLAKLVQHGLIDPAKETVLREAYVFLRTLEHRLQMVNDEQTHVLPQAEDGILHIAHFMGYGTSADFSKTLLNHLNSVHAIFASSFQSAEKLGDAGNLVFTGVTHDPETLETLRNMGYVNPEVVSEIIMGWHHGSRRSTRTKRAREILTELMPTLLKQLAETANPDAAFLKFNEFLSNLPAGVQIFSLFNINPQLLGLVADIMGSAPTLAEHLSKMPHLLDAVLYADFYQALPSKEDLESSLRETLTHLQDFESCMEGLRRFKNEKQFQAGVHLLKDMITAPRAGEFLSILADVILKEALSTVTREFEKSYGAIAGGQCAVIGLGKLGSKELTFGSDIDLVFVYDTPDPNAVSDGEKGFAASVYYNRLAQRFINALTTMGRDGRLYEVDTRLRPSGGQGLLATSLQGLKHYFDESAWTFEYMAFCKARTVVGDLALTRILNQFVTILLTKERDGAKLRSDVLDMRERIHKEFGTENPWDIKYARGGLIDIDFIAQYLLLKYAPSHPDAQPGSAPFIFRWLASKNVIASTMADRLCYLENSLTHVFHMLRLCTDRHFEEHAAPEGLKTLLYESLKESHFESLKKRLIEVEAEVISLYNQLLNL